MPNGVKPGAIFLFSIPTETAVKWMRAFIGPRAGDDQAWTARILMGFSTMTEAYELVDAMHSVMVSEADAFQRQALRSIEKSLTRVHAKLRQMDREVARIYAGVRSGIPEQAFLSALWVGVALPLTFGSSSVVHDISTIRNQLAAVDIQVTGSIISSLGRKADFGDLFAWPEQAFRQGVVWAWSEAQQSADDESATIRDVTESGLKAAVDIADRSVIRVVTVVKKASLAAAPWATIALVILGAFALRR